MDVYNVVKRLLDIAAASALLIFIAPVLLLIAAAIKLESDGPVLFVQQRMGCEGRMFRMFKFRSMKVGTPELSTDLLLNADDYTTKIGRFLRKTSLDECPQLINILLGDMSFVGPRPAMVTQYELNRERLRLGIMAIRPGLTGYAQINGRDSISDDIKLQLDRFYLENLSFKLDLAIVCATFLKVIKGDDVKG